MQKARSEGYRSRAVYKLDELLRPTGLTRLPSLVAVDLGAAPGGWSQYLSRCMGDRATVFALDLLPMDELPGVTFIEGDFTEDACAARLLGALNGARAGLVMSDMAPNISGNRAVDQPRAMYLAELALEFAGGVLAEGGTFVCKVFQGEGSDEFVRSCRTHFERVRVRKPKASRSSSREVYVLARNYIVV